MRIKIISCLFVFCGFCSADTEFDEHEASKKLLERKPLHMTASGQVDFEFERAEILLARKDLLTVIQAGYAEGLPEDEKPEFTVCQVSPGHYHYTNKNGENTQIEEVWIRRDPGKKISIALYSTGKRFFGDYQSLCVVHVTPGEESGVQYNVTVYAHPESFAVRMFSKVAPVEYFFRRKMNELTDLVVEVCNRIPVEEPQEDGDVAASR
jgi:hypothetical protein